MIIVFALMWMQAYVHYAIFNLHLFPAPRPPNQGAFALGTRCMGLQRQKLAMPMIDMTFIAWANSVDPDQPAHSHHLIRIYTFLLYTIPLCNIPYRATCTVTKRIHWHFFIVFDHCICRIFQIITPCFSLYLEYSSRLKWSPNREQISKDICNTILTFFLFSNRVRRIQP
jgi:hypothetical protein